MLKIILPFLFAVNASALTYTTNLSLAKPAAKDTNYVAPFATGMDTLDAAIPDKRANKTAIFSSSLTVMGPFTTQSSATVTGSAFSVGGSTLMVTGGKVGIGVTPVYKLQVDSARDSTFMVPIFSQSSDVVQGDRVLLPVGRAYSNGNMVYLGFYYDGVDSGSNRLALGFHSYDDAFTILNNNGNVGIGTITPDAKLHVIGGISASGDIVSSGSFRGGVIGSASAATLAQAAVSLNNEPIACGGGQYVTDISSMGVLTCGTPAGAGNVLLAATQTFTGANTFASTVTLSTRDKIILGNELHNSSSTFPLGGSIQGTAWLCAPGSTVTITTQGNTRVQVTHSGSMQISPASYAGYLTVIVDGVALNGQKGFCAQYLASGVAAGLQGCSFSVLTNALSAGAHTFCLAGRANNAAATLTFGYDDADNATQFFVQELR